MAFVYGVEIKATTLIFLETRLPVYIFSMFVSHLEPLSLPFQECSMAQYNGTSKQNENKYIGFYKIKITLNSPNIFK